MPLEQTTCCGAKLWDGECTITTMYGSDTAKSGFNAEDIFRTDANTINSLEKYFKNQ